MTPVRTEQSGGQWTPRYADSRDERGAVALVLVIWVMVVLLAIVGEFSYTMRTELNMARNFKEEEEAYQSARAGVELAKYEILSTKQPYFVFNSNEGVLVIGNKEESEPPVREGKLGNSAFSYTITDENGKVNINTATLQQLKNIISSTGVDVTEVDTIADSIIDWRDANDLHMLNGAEEDYYRSLEFPYSCKDGPFDIIEELLLVRGVTPEIFYGSQNEDTLEGYSGLVNYLTTWGSNRVNVNTSPREVLEAVLGAAHAENIVKQREAGPIFAPLYGGIVSSAIFTVKSTGTGGDGTIKRTIRVTLSRTGDKLEVIYWNDNVIG